MPPVDYLVNNAGIAVSHCICHRSCAHESSAPQVVTPFLETTRSDFDSIMNVNVRAVLNVSQVVARKMIDSGRSGSIVNVSSAASKQALKEHTSYCTSKAALDMLSRVMALELGANRIRVNTVNPTGTFGGRRLQF